MNINNVSSSSSASSVSNPNSMTGLMSGLDTDSMVESMLSGIQSKIDKQNQQEQVLTWKQEKYRDIITKVNDFQDKYFSLTSNNSLRTSSLFQSATATSSSSAVKILSASNTAGSEFTVNVKSVASYATVKSSSSVKNSIEVNSSATSYSREVTFSVKTDEVDENGNAKYEDININLAELMNSSGNTDKATFANALNKKLNAHGINVEYKPKTEDDDSSYDTLLFNSTDKEFKVSGSIAGLGMIGYLSASSSTKNEDDGTYKMKAGTLNPDIKLDSEIEIALDGVSKKFTIKEGQSIKDIEADIKKAFGSGINIVTDDATGKTSISANGSGRTVTIDGDSETLKTLGVTDKNSLSTRISTSSKISSLNVASGGKLTINGTEIEYSVNDTIAQVISKVNNSGAGVNMKYDALSDSFSITNSNMGSDFELSINDDSNLLEKLGFAMSGNSIDTSDSNYKEGKNAKIEINGVEIERPGNNIAYEGVTFQIKSETNGNPATITSERNVDKIVSVLKDFVNDYNELIGELNGYTHEKAEYKSYPPLTEAQKKEMTEHEIELWEEKSKTGLLRNDSDISKFLQNMRSAMYTKGSDSSLVLSNIGIDSSSNWQDYGKLNIDEDTLRKSLENNCEEIADMFTNSSSGLATRLNDICKQTVNVSSGSPGTLVSLAGVVGKASENNNTIYKQLENIKSKLSDLNSLYEKRKEKYWKMFSNMETTLSKYNSQSGYLSQMGM